MKRLITFALALVSFFTVVAQIVDPIKWTASLNMNDDESGTISVKVDMEHGWHIYGMESTADGPIATQITFTVPEGIVFTDDLIPSKASVEGFDETFQKNISWWSGSVTFDRSFIVEGTVSSETVVVEVCYQGCNDRSCLPPSTEEFTLRLPRDIVSVIDDDAANALDVVNSFANKKDNPANEDKWAPVDSDINGESVSASPWWKLFIWGFGSGFIALLTPCVWPLIPMTVSFFLKKGKSKRKAISDAITYGVSIIVIYLFLGLVITLLFGASELNALSTNAVFNLIFFLLLVVFAISFFGAFDIKLPSRWSNTADNWAERTTGLISIFFMAFTLALVSFSCTGPIVGTLLVETASSGNIAGAAVGMTGFALALALPFTLFAIFPSWLKDMPRSGGWLNSVKVVLGFLELALSLKFLSVADLAYGWGILDREIFLALWIVIFLLLGMYLLGKLRFAHDEPMEYVSIPRFFLSIASLGFVVYLIPGLWGAPLKGVSAFVPPLYTQDFSLYDNGFREFDNYDKGMAFAAENDRPVLVDFSGYGCVNCRKMEGAVFDTDSVSELIKSDFVLIKLMVDDKHKLKEPIEVEENGKTVTLKTVGAQWSYLQRHKFGANTQPYYVILDGKTGNALAPSRSFNENVSEFVDWLRLGLNNYNKANN